MVRAKLQYYYTFKVISSASDELRVEAHKWDEMGGHEETYVVRPTGCTFVACTCPAYRECKHLKCVKDTLVDGKIDELWKWRWDEKQGWTKLGDIPSVEDMSDV